jgi:hypothetical protein
VEQQRRAWIRLQFRNLERREEHDQAGRALFQQHPNARLHTVHLPASAGDQSAYTEPHSKRDGNAIVYTDPDAFTERHVAAVAKPIPNSVANFAFTNSDCYGYSNSYCDAEAYAQAPSLSRA